MTPAMAATRPTTAPLAVMTSRTLRSVAPSALIMPSARIRRCASTVNPAAESRPMKTSPSTEITSTIVAGLMLPVLPVCEASAALASAGRPRKTVGGVPGWPA